MNLVDAYVTKVLDTPIYIDKYPDVTWWEVQVEYNGYGAISKTNLTFKTKEEADAVHVGYKFLT